MLIKNQQQSLSLPSSRGGWTLIELLTVVAIIALLATGIIMMVSTQLGRARDATRIADLKDTQVYLERYSIDTGRYPVQTNFATMASDLGTQYSEYDNNTADPKNLLYTYNSDGLTYCMCAEFERHGEKANSNATCNFSVPEAEATHYCLVNKQ